MSTVSDSTPAATTSPRHETELQGLAPDDLPGRSAGSAGGQVRRAAQGCLLLTRPFQWHKNAVILVVPLLHATGPVSPAAVLTAVSLFVLASSATYVVNDLADRKRDRMHPVKRLRPVASGAVPVRVAICWAGLLYGTLGVLTARNAPQLALPVVAYVAMNLLYCFCLKHVALLDVFVIATGFLLRAWCGASAAGAAVSVWLLLSLFAACVLLGFGKRRHEFGIRAGDAREGRGHRPALSGYSIGFIDAMITFTAALSVFAYVSFLDHAAPRTGSAADAFVLCCALLAMLGMARYLQLLFVAGGVPDPSRTVLTDRWLLVVAGLWLAATVALPSLGKP